MRLLKSYDQRVYRTPAGKRLMGFVRSQLVPDGPEERVRQDVLRALVEEYHYPREWLLAEEPVARGTKNRRRADILVEIPVAARKDHCVALAAAEEERTSPPRYSEMLNLLRDIPATEHGLVLHRVPDEIDLPLDGGAVRSRVLGFSSADVAIALWLSPVSPSPELPRELAIHVLGYGMTDEEQALAADLDLSATLYRGESNGAFRDRLGAIEQDPRNQALLAAAISARGSAGWLVLQPRDLPRLDGVLAHVDAADAKWIDYFWETLADVPEIHWTDDIVLDRRGLGSVGVGDLVAIIDGDTLAEGAIVELGASTVLVDVGNAQALEAHRRPTPDAPWLGGVPTAPQSIAPASLSPASRERATGTFVVVECKAPHVTLTEEVKAQGLHYARTRGARYLVLTNGVAAQVFLLEPKSAAEVRDIPTFSEALSRDDFRAVAVAAQPPHVPLPADAASRPDLVRFHVRGRATFGTRSPRELWVPLLILDDVLHLDAPLFDEPVARYGCTLAEDLGLRWHEPGNPSGGSFPGEYRDFLLETAEGKDVIFGLKLNDYGMSVDAKGKRTGGHSLLSCCLSFGATYHPVLQCRLDKYLEVSKSHMNLWHSGRATVGKGSATNAAVIDYVGSYEPELVDGNRVILGTTPLRPGLGWPDVSDMVLRLARYVLLRHAFKEAVRRRKRRGRKRRR